MLRSYPDLIPVRPRRISGWFAYADFDAMQGLLHQTVLFCSDVSPGRGGLGVEGESGSTAIQRLFGGNAWDRAPLQRRTVEVSVFGLLEMVMRVDGTGGLPAVRAKIGCLEPRGGRRNAGVGLRRTVIEPLFCEVAHVVKAPMMTVALRQALQPFKRRLTPSSGYPIDRCLLWFQRFTRVNLGNLERLIRATVVC